MAEKERIKVVKSDRLSFAQTRRAGVFAARLIGSVDSSTQNIAVVDLEAGAHVEDHEIGRCESIYVVKGAVDVEFDEGSELLLPGDLVYFPKGTSHSLTPRRAPCRILLIFSG